MSLEVDRHVRMKNERDWFQTRYSPFIFAVGACLVLGSSLALVCTSAVYLPGYFYTKGFQEATCIVTSQNETGHRDCPCARKVYCWTKYPCVELVVNVSYGNDVVDESRVQLSHGYNTLKNLENGDKCSMVSCTREIIINFSDVRNFVHNFGQVGSNYTCYYNPTNKREVVVSRASSLILFFTLIFPAFGIVFGAIITVGIWKYDTRKQF